MLAEGGREAALADARQFLEQKVDSNDRVRGVRREADLGETDDFAFGLAGKEDLARRGRVERRIPSGAIATHTGSV